jgi:hypothetical protein
MTLSKDMFSALSGIAKTFQSMRPGDEYLAGLWKSTILEDLVCNVCLNIPRHNRPEKWRKWTVVKSKSPLSLCQHLFCTKFNTRHACLGVSRTYSPNSTQERADC